MKLRLIAVALIMAGAVRAEKIPMTFNAILSTGKEKRFGVATPGGTRSDWVALGDEFQGYKLSTYDDDAQTLVLSRDGKTYRLPLASGNVQPLASKATLDDAGAVLGKMKFEQMMTRMIDQQKQTVSALSKQMLGSIGAQVPADEFAAFQAKVMEALWSEMKPEDLKTDVAKIYADVFTKEELRGMSDFYATPAGGALIDKQPQMQQKMMELMMPRMMKAMPRIQEMSAEFAAQQQSKPGSGAAKSPASSTVKPASPAVKPPMSGAPASTETTAPASTKKS